MGAYYNSLNRPIRERILTTKKWTDSACCSNYFHPDSRYIPYHVSQLKSHIILIRWGHFHRNPRSPKRVSVNGLTLSRSPKTVRRKGL